MRDRWDWYYASKSITECDSSRGDRDDGEEDRAPRHYCGRRERAFGGPKPGGNDPAPGVPGGVNRATAMSPEAWSAGM